MNIARRSIRRFFAEHCLDCHASQDPDGKFILENFDALMQGGEIGKAVIPGKGADGLIVQMIEGRFEKDGKKKIMPPGKRKKLSPEEITVVKNWIDAGAPWPARWDQGRQRTGRAENSTDRHSSHARRRALAFACRARN